MIIEYKVYNKNLVVSTLKNGVFKSVKELKKYCYRNIKNKKVRFVEKQ